MFEYRAGSQEPSTRLHDSVLMDRKTGKILEGVPVMPRVRINHFKKDYMIMFQDMLAEVVKDKSFKLEELRIYLFVLSQTAMGNWLHMGQKEIAEQLGMTQGNVSRAFKNLTERKILEKTVQLGKSKAYRVSPDVVWKGPGAEYSKEMKKRTRDRNKALLKAVE